jgi:hypothetical protein
MDAPPIEPPTGPAPGASAPGGPPAGGPAEIEPYIRWARVLFAILIAVVVIGLVLLAVGGGLLADQVSIATPALILLAINGVASLVVYVVLVVALGNRRPWAIHAVAPVCYLLIAAGVVRVVVALSRSEVLIPLEAIGALLVLTRPHGRDLLPPLDDDGRTRVAITLVVLVATYLVPLASTLLAR